MSKRITSYYHDGLTFDVRDEGPLDGPLNDRDQREQLDGEHQRDQARREARRLVPRVAVG